MDDAYEKEGARFHAPRKCGSNAVVYDASVKSLVVYLSVVQFLPYGRIADFLREVCGLTISEGSMGNWINEAKVKAQPIIKKIQELIMQSRVVGFDESGCYCNKRLDWAWIAQTVSFTVTTQVKVVWCLYPAERQCTARCSQRVAQRNYRCLYLLDKHTTVFHFR